MQGWLGSNKTVDQVMMTTRKTRDVVEAELDEAATSCQEVAVVKMDDEAKTWMLMLIVNESVANEQNAETDDDDADVRAKTLATASSTAEFGRRQSDTCCDADEMRTNKQQQTKRSR